MSLSRNSCEFKEDSYDHKTPSHKYYLRWNKRNSNGIWFLLFLLGSGFRIAIQCDPEISPETIVSLENYLFTVANSFLLLHICNHPLVLYQLAFTFFPQKLSLIRNFSKPALLFHRCHTYCSCAQYTLPVFFDLIMNTKDCYV